MDNRKRGQIDTGGIQPSPPAPTPPPDPPQVAKRAEEKLEDIIARAAASAAREAVRARRKSEASTMLRNTALLMENCRQLRDFPARAISEAAEAGMAEGQSYLHSIRASRAKTMIMLAHLEASLQRLEAEVAACGLSYKYDAFHLHYVEGLTYEDIAEKLNTGKNTPSRWCKELNKRLSVILFGVDGLKQW